jgi:hypothetical protein
MGAVTRTRTADITLEGRYVLVRIHRGKLQTLADAQENVDGAICAGGGHRCPLLVDISVCEPLEPEVRHFLTGRLLDDAFLAQALLVEATAFGRMMGNVYLRVARPGIPTRLFTDEIAAIRWLETFVS